MQYRNILPLLLFLITFFCYSQDKPVELQIDEYKNSIVTAHDTVKIDLYEKIGSVYFKNEKFDEAIEYTAKAIELSEKYSKDFKTISLLKKITHYNRKNGNYFEGLSNIKRAILKAKINKYNKIDSLYFVKADIYFELKEFDSLEISTRTLIESTINKGLLKSAHNFLGGVYISQYHYEKAMDEFMIVRDISEEISDLFGICTALINIAVIHFEADRADDALSNIEKALQIAHENNYENAISFCNSFKGKVFMKKGRFTEAIKVLEIAHEMAGGNNLHAQLIDIKRAQGDVYREVKKYDLAINKSKAAIQLEKEIGATYHHSFIFMNLAKVYYELKQPEIALSYLDSVDKFIDIRFDDKKDYNELLSKIYADKKEYENAYLYYKNFVATRDSIDSITRKNETYQLEANYQFKQKEDEIEILNTKNKLRESQLYMLIGFVGLTLLLLFFIYSRFKTKARINKQLKELDKTKTRFFTNISHEFRTPLSLMLGPIQTVLKDVKKPNNITNLNLAYKNGARLHNMVNQLLDLSKIESNSIPLEVEEMMIPDFLKVVFSYFSSMADEKRIDYKIEIEDSLKIGFLDKDKVEKILINLLSNAFKFTPNDGSIKLSAYKKGEQLIINISDSGIGIPKDKIDKIFNRFYQVDDSQTRTAEGSGIGLALSKELADTHKGSLKATSKEEQGSTFTLKIPIKKGAYNKGEMRVGLSLSTIKDVSDIELIENKLTPNITGYKKEQPLLLIVEDNVDMQSFIASILNKEYNILIASNGKEAYSIALEEVPDIIISDYMMPIMDGMSFSKMIRNQEATSHIPIVMLTAKNEQSTKLESLETGVNSFLTKPFNTDELQLVVNNIMEQQNKLKKLYSESSTLPVKDISLPSSEKSFIERMMTIFEEKYGLTYFGVEQLSDELCLSRVQIYRKVKALTGESPGDLLRVFRLEKAKILLEKSSSNVGEVSEKVGFGNQSNFANKFKKHTGMSPSEYMSQKFKTK